MPPKSEREETLNGLTQRIFFAMLDELVMDVTLQSHHEVIRSKVVCPVCLTRCGSRSSTGDASQVPLASGANVSSRAATPSSAASNEFTAAARPSATGTSTPTGKDGNLYLVCDVCSRQIASNRYAPHLASCMGLASSRRGASKRLPSDAGRSTSPISDSGIVSDEKESGKGKGHSKADESEFTLNGNGKRKRASIKPAKPLDLPDELNLQPVSPQISSNKKSKKGKLTGSPVSRVKANPDISGLPTGSHYSPSTNSQSRIPSKLRDSSIASFPEPSSTSSRESSLEAVPTPSSISSKSPVRPPVVTNNAKPAPRSRPPATGTGPPLRRPSPPRPQPIHVPHYDEIDHANETGSSTDTDSEP